MLTYSFLQGRLQAVVRAAVRAVEGEFGGSPAVDAVRLEHVLDSVCLLEFVLMIDEQGSEGVGKGSRDQVEVRRLEEGHIQQRVAAGIGPPGQAAREEACKRQRVCPLLNDCGA